MDELFANDPAAKASPKTDKPSKADKSSKKASGKPRVRVPQRDVREMTWESLDERLAPDAQVRTVWSFVLKLDLSKLLGQVKALEHGPGRDGTDPRLLLALWLYGSIEGVGSARQLDELCRRDRPFEWLCGGVSVNYHMLADFRSQHADLLDELMAQSIASLVHEGLLDVNTVAQDGMRVRASAGSDSFRREAKLEQHLADARAHLKTLREELELNPAQLESRRKSAKLRGAAEKTERLEKALEQVQAMAQSREARKEGDGGKARASSTDPEARRMKIPDGGTRPAYNAQLATDAASGLVVGVHASGSGNDAGELAPMLRSIRASSGKVPQSMLVDGGYATKANVELAHREGVVLYAPLKEEADQLAEGKDPYAAKKGDSEAMKQFRARMGQEESKEKYAWRGRTAELSNAHARNANLYAVRVRGVRKVQAVLVLWALAHNLMRAETLRRQKAAQISTQASAQADEPRPT